MSEKVICEECEWHGTIPEIVLVPDPGGDDIWRVCPVCRTPEHLVPACERVRCWREVSCGTPTVDGYAQTCGEHVPIK